MKVRVIFAIIAGSFCLFLPNLGSVNLFDWDEVNFAECSREMLASGNYVRVQMDFQPFFEKPPFFFWLQSLSMYFFGVNAWAARFPNVLCGVVTLLVLFKTGARFHNQKLGIKWVLVYVGSWLPQLYFRTGIIDPWFNLFIFLNVIELHKAIYSNHFSSYFKAGIWAGLAVLTKGPVAILITGIMILVYGISEKFYIRWLGWFGWLGVCLVIASLWFLPETWLHGPQFLKAFIQYQWELLQQDVASHGQPWYYHPLVLLFGVFPATVFAVGNLIRKFPLASPAGWMQLFFWVVLILFSLVKTKIIHYSSLCYFPLTYFAAVEWENMTTTKRSQSIILWITGILLTIGLWILYIFPSFKSSLISIFTPGPIAINSLKLLEGWPNGAWLGPVIFSLGFVITLVYWKKYPAKSYFILLLSSGLSITIAIWQFTPTIEKITQQPAIDMCQSVSGAGQIVKTLDFKSYIPSFYGKSKSAYSDLYLSTHRLLWESHPLDIYFLAHAHREKELITKFPQLSVVQKKGAFIFLHRNQ